LPIEGCVAVNVFFNSFDTDVYSKEGKDLYGNKDLTCYEKGRVALASVKKELEDIEEEARKFYLIRLGQELLDSALT